MMFYLSKFDFVLFFSRLATVGQGFRKMEELYGLEARLSLYNTNGESDNHARYEWLMISKKLLH